MTSTQQEIDRKNALFWNEPCGTALAKSIGVDTLTPKNIRRFDESYLSYYPYLRQYLFLDKLKGKRVLEIGVGFGTIGQQFVIAGSRFVGIDIAEEPVKTLQYRLRLLGKTHSGLALVASTLNLPFADERFDYVFAMGVIHHTGNLSRAISEIHRVLVPGGKVVIMIYNRFSYRSFLLPLYYLRYRLSAHPYHSFGEFFRSLYDTNQRGEAAPRTEFVSRRLLRKLMRIFSSVHIEAQNCDPVSLRFGKRMFVIPREKLLPTVARILGLDLYVVTEK